MTIDGTRRSSPAALAIVGVVALGIAVFVVLNSSFFAIRQVRVEGARHVSSDEIRRVAAIPTDDNLVMFEIDSVTARLEEHPWIAEAQIDRDLPSTVVIRVVERVPGGLLLDPQGIVVVAGDGVVLERADGRPPRVPEVGSWPEILDPGGEVEGLEKQLRVTSSMPAPLLRRIASAGLEGPDIVLRLRDGGAVLYGAPTELDAKNRALGDMLRWAVGQGIAVRTIDVRVPAAPSLEPARGGPVPTPITSP